MAETYPQRVAVVRGGNVIATVTVDSDGDRQSYSENFGTAVFSMEEAKTLGLPQKLRLEIVDALRASQDAADLAETGRRLMAKRLNGSGGAPPDLGGPPAQLPPEPISIQRYDMITTQVGSCMSKFDDGDWVMFDDVEHLIGGTA